MTLGMTGTAIGAVLGGAWGLASGESFMGSALKGAAGMALGGIGGRAMVGAGFSGARMYQKGILNMRGISRFSKVAANKGYNNIKSTLKGKTPLSDFLASSFY